MDNFEYNEYTTLKNDTFDIIALDFYNDEFMADKIIQANYQYRDIILFDSGVLLKIPIIDVADEDTVILPPWC